MEKSDFDKLLERYLTGQVTEAERIKLEAWMEVMKSEAITELDLSKHDEDQLFQKITANTDDVNEVITFRPQGNSRTWLTRVAAGILLISVASAAIWFFAYRNVESDNLASNNITKSILKDGTIAWLHGDSKLIYTEKPEEGIRYAEFEGEALFEIAKDASRPFIIKCGASTIRVLGTSFSLKSGTERLELKVLTGRVLFSAEGNDQGLNVDPHEMIIFRPHAAVTKSTVPENELPAITANTEYKMEFSNTAMEEVIARLEKKFNVSITPTNNAIKSCRLTADLTDHSLETSLGMISEVMDVKYSRQENKITLTGSGCQTPTP